MLPVWFSFLAVWCTNSLLVNSVSGQEAWYAPGCHKVGHIRNISIPNCVQFSISTNACRGFCVSFAVPSWRKGFVQPITSMAECCNMMETELVEAKVLCLDGFRTIAFKSAISCSCHHCHTRKISIPNCVEFHMTTNACRGYCVSFAVPSSPQITDSQPVTSIGQCCNIMETESVNARVLCVDGVRTLTFESAVTCSCYHCKKD